MSRSNRGHSQEPKKQITQESPLDSTSKILNRRGDRDLNAEFDSPEVKSLAADNLDSTLDGCERLADKSLKEIGGLGSTLDVCDGLASNEADSRDIEGLVGLDQPLPRSPRRPRRARRDRGLPPDLDIERLATLYLEFQRHHWPSLVDASLLPEISSGAIAEMVDDFKARHRGEKEDADGIRQLIEFGLKIGGNYNRYSCDRSNSTSIDDQMHNVLVEAHSESVFIPWIHVYCDYSVSGLDASRQGYSR
jgi:hypothetical protein